MTEQLPIYIVMDALDECPNDSGIPSPREKVLDLVQELVELHHPTLRLCITSRPEYDIRTTLEPLATQQVSTTKADKSRTSSPMSLLLFTLTERQ